MHIKIYLTKLQQVYYLQINLISVTIKHSVKYGLDYDLERHV